MVGVLLRDPYDEFAERLLILKLAGSPRGGTIAASLGPIVEAAAAHLRDVDLQNIPDLEAVLEAAPVELRAILYNPLTYLLTAQNAFDPPPAPATAVALESLADMDAVGLLQDTAPFFETVSAVLDLPKSLTAISLPTNTTVIQWANLLRDRPIVRSQIEMDLEVYRTVADILERQVQKQAAASA